MEFIGEKLNSFTGEALSGINEMKRKKRKQEEQSACCSSEQQVDQTNTSANTNRYELLSSPQRRQPISAPFGGDSLRLPPPPPIGFRTDFIITPPPPPSTTTIDQHSTSAEHKNWQHQPDSRLTRQNGASEQSLYEGDAWSRLWFQRVMILSFIRLLLFIRKVYEDFHATKTYNITGHTGHFLISAATLFLPTIIFTLYRVSRYLQIVLPPTRALTSTPYPRSAEGKSSQAHEDSQPSRSVSKSAISEAIKNGEDAQVGKALISPSAQAQEDEGLVTARQTPTNLEEFHDSRSQQEQTLTISLDRATSPAPSTAIVKDSPQDSKQIEPIFKESIDIDKLGNIPDKPTTRIVIGASEQLLHGILFIFWQLKRQVDVMGYLVERSCLWRKPRNEEKEELGHLRTGSDGLEWFQDFYAAFLAILAQVYTLGLHWASNEKAPLHTSTLNSAATSLSGLAGSESPDLAVSKAAETISRLVSQQAAAGNVVGGKDVLIMSELIVSSAVVFSLLIAVRRRDDGPLTFGLSMIGWGSIFASRIIIIALAFVHVGWKIMLPLIICHIFGITGWVYKIAIDSHNGKKDESEDWKWEVGELTQVRDDGQTIELEEGVDSKTTEANPTNITSQWSIMEHVVLLSQVITLFAIPSLFYWPIMFNLKLHYRPFKYLVLILSENFMLIPIIWFSISTSATPGQWYLLCAVCAFSILGFIFVSLYVSCKPSLTEYFARADELFNEAEQSGIYYEFCSRVFKMPDLSKETFTRLMNQTEQVEEIDEIQAD